MLVEDIPYVSVGQYFSMLFNVLGFDFLCFREFTEYCICMHITIFYICSIDSLPGGKLTGYIGICGRLLAGHSGTQ